VHVERNARGMGDEDGIMEADIVIDVGCLRRLLQYEESQLDARIIRIVDFECGIVNYRDMKIWNESKKIVLSASGRLYLIELHSPFYVTLDGRVGG
jgi:hypothetical protein